MSSSLLWRPRAEHIGEIGEKLSDLSVVCCGVGRPRSRASLQQPRPTGRLQLNFHQTYLASISCEIPDCALPRYRVAVSRVRNMECFTSIQTETSLVENTFLHYSSLPPTQKWQIDQSLHTWHKPVSANNHRGVGFSHLGRLSGRLPAIDVAVAGRPGRARTGHVSQPHIPAGLGKAAGKRVKI